MKNKKKILYVVTVCFLLLFSLCVFFATNAHGQAFVKTVWNGMQSIAYKLQDTLFGYQEQPPEHTVEECYDFNLNTYGENFMTGREKEIVAVLKNLAENISSDVVPVRSISAERFEQLVNMFLYQYPEYFYVKNASYLKDSNGNITAVSLGYEYSPEEIAERKQGVEETAAGVTAAAEKLGSEREKAYFLHDYVVKNTEYQLDSPDNQNMSSVFLNGKSACAGYAKSLVYLLRQSGMEAMYVTGTTGGVAHAFVMARIDGELYYIDPTMDDPVFEEGQSDFTTYVNSPYLCVTTEMLKVSHTIDEDYYPLPVCDSTDANYHAVQGLLFNENSAQTRDALREALRTAVENKQEFFSFRFMTDKEAYAAFRDTFFSRRNAGSVFNMLESINRTASHLVRYDTVSYFCSDGALYCALKLNYLS